MKESVRQVVLALASAGALLAQDAQSGDDQLAAAIRMRDTKFWTAYNTCALERLDDLFTRGVEFYHDKGGVTVGFDRLIENLKANLCGSSGGRLRRELIPGTEAVFPLRNGDEIYGAILSGEHVFYVTPPGESEFLDGRANFTHLWLKEDGTFKMARVLSFNHRPANERKAIALSHEQLDLLAGTYVAPKSGRITITREGDVVLLQTEKTRFRLHPQTPRLFFVKERDVTFEFEFQPSGRLKMIVRERGAIVEEILREP